MDPGSSPGTSTIFGLWPKIKRATEKTVALFVSSPQKTGEKNFSPVFLGSETVEVPGNLL